MSNILKKKINFFNGDKPQSKDFYIKTENKKMFPWNIHYPPNIQEWSDSVYTYNKNYIKSIPGSANDINRLVTGFFNMTFLNTKFVISARKRIEHRRKLINKIFVSKALVKHTNNKAIITLFTYNREKLFFIKKIHDIYNKLKEEQNNKPVYSLDVNNYILKKIYMVYSNKYILKKKTTNLISRVIRNDNYINKKTNNEIKLLLRISNKKSTFNNNSFLVLFNVLNYKYKKYNSLIFYIEKLYFYQKKILLLNNYTHKDFFLLQLKSLISRIYNKNTEFKIINLKKLSLNSDIFTQAVVRKLKNRKNTVLRVLNRSLGLIKPVVFNKHKMLDYDLENKKKDKDFYLVNKKKNKLNKFLNKTFCYGNSLDITNKISENVIYDLKNKFIKGVKLQARGRLTTRLIASRAVNKFKYKGNIKNVDSSYKGLSTVLLKGSTKPNIQYTLTNSVGRNGSFGVKGWISSY